MNWPVIRATRKQPQNIYLRFGRWNSRSLNHCTGEPELGVSVYPAKFDKNGVAILDWDGAFWPDAISGRCVWAVTGEVCGIGSDGEPLLRKVTARPFPIRKTW